MPALEEVLAENNTLLREMIGLMRSKGGATPTSVTSSGRGPGRPRQVTLEEVTAIAQKVSSEKSKPVAAKLIADVGGGKLGDMPKEKYAEFIARAELILKAQEEAPASAEDDEL